MCAIAGLCGCGDRETLERMCAVQAHRGPDDSGVWERSLPDGSWLGLGSRRLAVQDVSPAGHMPMGAPDGRLWIVQNGEIYNAPELRRELEARGERFASRGDTEVLLKLYARDGLRMLDRIEGMFALAICDLRGAEPELILARDPFGIKPLYYARPGGGLAFASELKALLEAPGVGRDIDPRALDRYLSFLWVPEPETVFTGVRKLPAGHYARFRGGRFSVEKYWDLSFPPDGGAFPGAPERLAVELRERFFAAVRGQMLSDVPLGAFLSAGLDSSAILAAMAEASPAPVRTYTVTFPARYRRGETNLDDPAVARRTAARFGARHEEILVEPDVAALLPRLLWHMDEPVADPAILTAYSVCRAARRDVTVLLSGIGGDEVFGGYRKYQANLAAGGYRRLPGWLRRGVIEPVLRDLPALGGTPLKGYAGWARKWARSASLDPVGQFIMDATYMDAERRRDVAAFGGGGEVDGAHRGAFAASAGAARLNQMLYADVKIFLPSLNLNYNDKMSMASSLEVRVPFLDRGLVEWTARNVPPSLKIRGLTTKYLLREAMKGVLPDEVLRQPKASFGAPVGYWLEADLREMTDDVLSERRLKERGWLRPAAVRRMIEEHRSGRRDWALQLWQFLTLELWARSFLDGARP